MVCGAGSTFSRPKTVGGPNLAMAPCHKWRKPLDYVEMTASLIGWTNASPLWVTTPLFRRSGLESCTSNLPLVQVNYLVDRLAIYDGSPA